MQDKPRASEELTLAVPPAPFASGERVGGRFEVIELYGSGPLGHTLKAVDLDGTPVAVKVIHRSLAPTVQERETMLHDLSKLMGRSIERVSLPIDAGIERNVAYVVSPWIPGKSLRRVIGAYRDAGQVMPGEEVRGVIEGVVLALRQLHASTPHGALYPESVQISRDGRVLLTDAAIAGTVVRNRWIEHLDYFPDVLPYVAPEVRTKKPPNAGADLWSVGALASELLTGDPSCIAEGIAAPQLTAWPASVAAALAGLVEAKAAKRAIALPALLRALELAYPRASLPITGALPPQRARTELMSVPAAGVTPYEGTSPGIVMLGRKPKKRVLRPRHYLGL